MVFRLIISGEHACFPREEVQDALVTHDIITPIAALGLIESIHWKPAIRWHILRIHILEPVRRVKVPGPWPTLALLRPRWAVDIDFELTTRAGPADSFRAHEEMFRKKARRLPEKHCYLGLMRFPASIMLISAEEPLNPAPGSDKDLDLGWIPFRRLDRNPARFGYFHACARGGVLHLPTCTEGRSLLAPDPGISEVLPV